MSKLNKCRATKTINEYNYFCKHKRSRSGRESERVGGDKKITQHNFANSDLWHKYENWMHFYLHKIHKLFMNYFKAVCIDNVKGHQCDNII